MLDSVKRVKELRDLLAAAKQEREQTADALASLFTRSEQVDAVARSMKRAHDEAHTLSETLERLAGRVDTLDGRLSAVETIDARIAAVNASLGGVERTVQDLVGPDGHLPKYRALAQQVDSQEVQARASIEALKKDQLALDELRDQLRQAHVEVKDANDRASAVKADVEQVRVLGAQLAQDYGKIRDTSREAREHASATMETARDIEKKFASFAALEEMSKTAKERLAGLNLLAEHVTQKTKSLENQKQTLEHAIVESNRLNELVWNMDAQVAKLSESLKQVARTEETVEHLDKIARETAAHVEAATKSKEAFLEDVARIDRDHAALTDFIRSYDERLALERKELDSFDQRIVVVQAAIADVARNVDGVLAKDRALATMTQQIGALETQTGTLLAQVTDVHRRQADLESLRDRLDEVGGLAARTQDQFEYLTQMRTDLETLKGGIDEFYVSHEAAARLVDRLDADRVSLATFMERMDGFRVITPELDAKLDTVTSRLSIVDEGVHKASNLVALADELDRQMTRIANNQRFVDKVEQRVNALHATASDINGKLAEQLARRAEIDTLKSACDTVSVQVSDVQQKLESVSSVQQALSPLRTEIATLKTQIEHAYARFKETQRDEAEVAEQERRLKELLNANRDSSAEVAARLAQVRALTDALQRSTASKDELMEELARVQAAGGEA
ncbi:MAG: hypothetical protein NTY02_17895, partial [Acidobacteria bacterium]|nr:hypothetical protein [Acidobacteriota bacterium]